MLIRIEDLPNDRKLKCITIDISFEEDGSANVKSTPTYTPDRLAPPFTFKNNEDGMPVTSLEMPVVQVALPSDIREHKEIPPEMKDIQF